MYSTLKTFARRFPPLNTPLWKINNKLFVRAIQAFGLTLLLGFTNEVYRMNTVQQKQIIEGLRTFNTTEVCKSSDIKEGTIRSVDLPNGRKIIIIRYKGKLHAVSGQCTYDNVSPLSQGICFGDKLFCCEHGCAYDIQTGRVQFPPAINDLPRFYVEERGGKVILHSPNNMPVSIQPLAESRDYTDMRKVVIVGNGMAALGCIEGLRQNGYTGEITVISKESQHPYNDQIYMKTFRKMYKNSNKQSQKPFPRPEQWYNDLGVEFIFNQEIVDIDAREHYPFVILEDDIRIEYDALLLTMGTSPMSKKIPGLSKGGNVFILNQKQDYDSLAQKLLSQKVNDITVLGYNLKSLEFIKTIKKQFPSINISVIDANEKSVVQQRLGGELALLLVEDDAKYGVSFYLRVPVLNVERNKQKMRINMKFNQQITTDVIVMFPNNQISNAIKLQSSKVLEIDMSSTGNIKTDQTCRTSNKQIFAAGRGSIIHFFYGDELIPCLNNRMAYQQGYTAAYNILALNIPYHMVPFQSIQTIGKKVLLVGNNSLFDNVHLFGDIDAWDFVVVYTLADHIVGCATSPSQKRIAGIFEQAFREEVLPNIEAFKRGGWTFQKLEQIIRKNKKAGCYKDPIDEIRQTYKTNPRDILWMHRDVQGTGMRVIDDADSQKKPLNVDKDGYVKYPGS